MGWMFDKVVRLIARPQRPPNHCEPFTRNDSTALRTLFDPVTFFWSRAKVAFPAASDISINRPWSHSALYIGPMAGVATEGEPHVPIEANVDEGVVSASLSKYLNCQTHICRRWALVKRTAERSAATLPNALVSATISRTLST